VRSEYDKANEESQRLQDLLSKLNEENNMIEAVIAVKEKEIEQNRQRQDTLTVSLDQANENLMQVSKQLAKAR
jgi:uncharacterized protein (UPF0371 family)